MRDHIRYRRVYKPFNDALAVTASSLAQAYKTSRQTISHHRSPVQTLPPPWLGSAVKRCEVHLSALPGSRWPNQWPQRQWALSSLLQSPCFALCFSWQSEAEAVNVAQQARGAAFSSRNGDMRDKALAVQSTHSLLNLSTPHQASEALSTLDRVSANLALKEPRGMASLLSVLVWQMLFTPLPPYSHQLTIKVRKLRGVRQKPWPCLKHASRATTSPSPTAT